MKADALALYMSIFNASSAIRRARDVDRACDAVLVLDTHLVGGPDPLNWSG